jgi:hypothetical protein
VINFCYDKDFFTVSRLQEKIFNHVKRILGGGTMKELRLLRRYCSRRRDNLEEEHDNDEWLTNEEDTKKEELKIMQMMEFMYVSCRPCCSI